MTPERVRAMVSAMQAAGEDDDAIRSALTLAKSQERPSQRNVTTPADAESPGFLDVMKAGGGIGEFARELPGNMNALASKFMNGLTFGGANRVRRAIAGDESANRAEADEQSRLSSAPGQYAGNLMSLTGGGVVTAPIGGGIVGMLEQKVPAMATNAGGRILANTAAGGGVGALAGTTEAAFEGEKPKEVLRRGLSGLVSGSVLGGGLSAIGEGAQGISDKIRSNPLIGRFRAATESGAYEQPEMKTLPKGRQGMQEAADTAVERMGAREKALDTEAQAAWNLTGASPEVLKQPVDAELIKGRLHAGKLAHVDPDTGMPADGADSIVAAYDKAIERTGGKATVEGVLKRRQSLKKAAAFDSPNPSPEQMAARDVYHTFRSAIRDASPELAAADDAYSAHSSGAERRVELVGTDLRTANPSQMESAAARVGRIEDENVPGLRAQKRLEELRASDPEYASAMDFLANKKAQEGVRFGAPHMPTHLSAATMLAGIPRVIGQNARALGAKVVDPLAGRTSNLARAGGLSLPAFLPEIEQLYADYLQRQKEKR